MALLSTFCSKHLFFGQRANLPLFGQRPRAPGAASSPGMLSRCARRRRKLPRPPPRLPQWIPDGIWGSAGLLWNPALAARPVCAAATPDGVIVVADHRGTSFFFAEPDAARALRPQVAQTELLGRLLQCPYVWGERTTVFSELFRCKGAASRLTSAPPGQCRTSSPPGKPGLGRPPPE